MGIAPGGAQHVIRVVRQLDREREHAVGRDAGADGGEGRREVADVDEHVGRRDQLEGRQIGGAAVEEIHDVVHVQALVKALGRGLGDHARRQIGAVPGLDPVDERGGREAGAAAEIERRAETVLAAARDRGVQVFRRLVVELAHELRLEDRGVAIEHLAHVCARRDLRRPPLERGQHVGRIGAVRIEPQHDLEMAFGVVVAAEVLEDVTEIVVGIGVRRPDADGAAIGRDRLVVEPAVAERVGQIVVGIGEVGPKRHRLAVRRRRLVKDRRLRQGIAEVEMRLGEIGLQRQRAAMARNRILDAAGVAQRVAEIVVDGGEIGRVVERGLEARDRIVDLALVAQHVAEIVVRRRVAGPDGDGVAIEAGGFLVFVLGMQRVAAVVVALGQLGIEGEGLAV